MNKGGISCTLCIGIHCLCKHVYYHVFYYTIVCTCKWADYSRVENSSFSLSERSGTGIISSRMKDIKEIIHGV